MKDNIGITEVKSVYIQIPEYKLPKIKEYFEETNIPYNGPFEYPEEVNAFDATANELPEYDSLSDEEKLEAFDKVYNGLLDVFFMGDLEAHSQGKELISQAVMSILNNEEPFCNEEEEE